MGRTLFIAAALCAGCSMGSGGLGRGQRPPVAERDALASSLDGGAAQADARQGAELDGNSRDTGILDSMPELEASTEDGGLPDDDAASNVLHDADAQLELTPFQARFSEQCLRCVSDADCGEDYTCFTNECRRRCTSTGSADLSDTACGLDDSSIGLQCSGTSDSDVSACKSWFGTSCDEWRDDWSDLL